MTVSRNLVTDTFLLSDKERLEVAALLLHPVPTLSGGQEMQNSA
jgi:hypothetical protein